MGKFFTIQPVSVAGFTNFIRLNMGIDTTVLPDNSPAIPFALQISVDIVNLTLNVIPDIYVLAVYNLGGDNLINYAADLPGAATIPGSDPPAPFFKYSRNQYNCLKFIPGVIQSASDEGTSSSYLNIEAAKDFTMANLQNLKTPWGRQYLAFAQDYGTSIWGLTP
jgi:hypothetical protein